MQPGVDDKAASAKSKRLKIAKAADLIIVVKTKFVRQLLGVERPTFAIGIEGQHGADQRHLVRIFALPNMTGDGFMESKVGQAVFAVQVSRAKVDPELPGD